MSEKIEQTDKKCSDGYSPGDPWVVPVRRYSFVGWLLMSCGISHPPKQVNIECDRCGFVFETISDKTELKKYL